MGIIKMDPNLIISLSTDFEQETRANKTWNFQILFQI